MPPKALKNSPKAKNITVLKETKSKHEVKTIDTAAKLSSILSVFETRGKELGNEFKTKIMHSLAKTAMDIVDNPDTISDEVKQNLNLQFLNRLFKSYNFQSYKSILNSSDSIYDQKILELMANVNQKVASIESNKKEIESIELEKTKSQNRQKLIQQSEKIKQAKKARTTERKASILESDVNAAAGPDQYMSMGQIHSGERFGLPNKLSDNILPANQKWVITEQIMSCIANDYGISTIDDKLNTSASEMEKGISQYALDYFDNTDQKNNKTKVISMVKFPAFSKADSDLKVDIASLRVDQNISQNQLKLLETYFKLANRIYPFSEDKILQSSIATTPTSFKELLNNIESMNLNNHEELISTLTEYVGVTKVLKEKINSTTLDLLSNDDTDIDLNQIADRIDSKNLSSLSKIYFEAVTLLKKLENLLVTSQDNKISMMGLQIKTSANAALEHINKNGNQVPVAIGNTNQALNTIINSDTQVSLSYIDALKNMCNQLL